MRNNKKIKVFILEDKVAFIDGLRLYFQHSNCIEYAGSAITANQCLEMTKHKPNGAIDIFLMDIVINNDRLGGIKLARRLKERYRFRNDKPSLVFLTGNESKEYQEIAKDLDASFLNKNMRIPAIIERLKQIHFERKKVYERVKPTISDMLQSELKTSLTPSEGRIVVNLGALGSNKDVAIKLLELQKEKDPQKKKIKAITDDLIAKRLKTVNTHLVNIYRKLDLEYLVNLINAEKEYSLISKSDNRSMLMSIVKESKLIDHIDEINRYPKKWF